MFFRLNKFFFSLKEEDKPNFQHARGHARWKQCLKEMLSLGNKLMPEHFSLRATSSREPEGARGPGGRRRLYPVGGVFPSAHGLQHGFIQTELQTRLVEHLPFVRIPRDQPVDFHGFALPYPVTPCLGLEEKRELTATKKERLRRQL